MKSNIILVAEDNPHIRSTLDLLIRGEGFTPLCVENGKRALTALRELTQAPAAILLDLHMPVMSGEEFLDSRASINLFMDTPVIVFSVEPQTRKLPGVTDWITKPVDLDRFLEALRRHCGPPGVPTLAS